MSRESIRMPLDLAPAAAIERGEMIATSAAGAVPFTGAAGQTFFGLFAERTVDQAAGAQKVVGVTGLAPLAVDAGVTPKAGEDGYVVDSKTATNVAPALGATEKWCGRFVQPSHQAGYWLFDFRPAYYRKASAVA